MKYITSLVKFLPACLILLPLASLAQAPQLSKVDMISRAKNAYRIQDNEAAVAGDLIKRVQVGKTTAVITYFNKTKSPLKPSFHFHVLNAYGMEIASFWEEWVLAKIEPGEVREENSKMYVHEIEAILKYSGIALPEDWSVPVYLMVDSKP